MPNFSEISGQPLTREEQIYLSGICLRMMFKISDLGQKVEEIKHLAEYHAAAYEAAHKVWIIEEEPPVLTPVDLSQIANLWGQECATELQNLEKAITLLRAESRHLKNWEAELLEETAEVRQAHFHQFFQPLKEMITHTESTASYLKKCSRGFPTVFSLLKIAAIRLPLTCLTSSKHSPNWLLSKECLAQMQRLISTGITTRSSSPIFTKWTI